MVDQKRGETGNTRQTEEHLRKTVFWLRSEPQPQPNAPTTNVLTITITKSSH